MKKVLLLLIMSHGIFLCNGLPQPASDSTQKDSASENKPGKTGDTSGLTTDTSQAILQLRLKQAQDSSANKVDTSGDCLCYDKGVNGWDWVLVFAPVLLFLTLMIILLSGKGLNQFDFKGALAENEMPKYTIINPEYIKKYDGTGGVSSLASLSPAPASLSDILPPTLEVTIIPTLVPTSPPEDQSGNIGNNYRPSISRYIAFFSGMLTVIIAVCMASFFIYHYIRRGCPPDISGLSTVLIALGIGVAPYAINKLSNAIASRKTDE